MQLIEKCFALLYETRLHVYGEENKALAIQLSFMARYNKQLQLTLPKRCLSVLIGSGYVQISWLIKNMFSINIQFCSKKWVKQEQIRFRINLNC